MDRKASPLLNYGSLQWSLVRTSVYVVERNTVCRQRLLKLCAKCAAVTYGGSSEGTSQRPGAGNVVHDVCLCRHTRQSCMCGLRGLDRSLREVPLLLLLLLLHEVDAEGPCAENLPGPQKCHGREQSPFTNPTRLRHKSRAIMSKRNNDGDILANRLILGVAKGNKFLASKYGVTPSESIDSAPNVKNEEDDFKQNVDPDR